MSDSQKFPFLKALSNAMQHSAEDRNALSGRELPCHVVAVKGQIVTVQFDMLPGAVQYPQVTIPIATFPYILFPVQIGDKGVTLAADVSLRGVSGLGTGLANLSLSPSLTPLFFVPISSSEWSEEDPNKIVIHGPEGATIKTSSGNASVSVSESSITLSVGGQTLELSSSGLTHNGVNIGDTHKHDVKGVEAGGSSVSSEGPK